MNQAAIRVNPVLAGKDGPISGSSLFRIAGFAAASGIDISISNYRV
jgi:hypothetical protein